MSIGYVDPNEDREDAYQPFITFNLQLKSYISDTPDLNKYWSYGYDSKLSKLIKLINASRGGQDIQSLKLTKG